MYKFIKPITVKHINGEYNIYFQDDFQSLFNKYLNIKSNNVLIYDNVLSKTHLKEIVNSLNELKIPYTNINITSKEYNKNFDTLNYIINAVLKFRIDRHSTIISMGGGIIGDLSGFAASILLRGINYISIPTTLLACVDSSIGGKTGINHALGKNLIGSFYQPKAVIINSAFLSTLTFRELLSGFAEIIKYALIYDKDLWEYLILNNSLLKKKDLSFIKEIIIKSCKVKKKFVEQDELELNNKRILLNFGHSFGHALEKMNNYKNDLTHGEAVAIGMCMALKYSSKINILDEDLSNQIITFIKSTGLPISPLHLNDYNAKDLIKCMLNDKKNTANILNLILLTNISKAKLIKNINQSHLLDFLEKEYK